ncbi:MAG: phosphopantetheine adenylyltransferase [Nitrososphaerota archaeon]|jgi:pantetheine-phosphate adenylyltransferase|uniref:phosphopantetheine adenylyltransferase n=1 Tax=Candidatus Bathycorpusculum sp. TaxID=2994959 RepID=UPI002834C16F|nr:phosphopantetheine adenylyltransferase [Candidatus Termiticorpusculum sp.]MCL2256927.1 phosphopantetheine adenylyltransferase [Candidatus Termiticorpusculum sp.]MCL2292934.1 phosphopantetheine adenylyltransferase [Candidatus Termiticorpusculum sp.]MDR0460276.1 phosphopantetheine adenylyltransferase [Nitrososphaerota archaeon]
MITKRPYRNVGVGGTFDALHKGHRALISKAFEVGDYVFIGLTSDKLAVELQKSHKIAPYKERLAALYCFLEKTEFKNRFEISTMHTPYGLTLNRTDLNALVVSQETVRMGECINEKRVQAGLSTLSIVKIDLVPAENKKPISTTRIRAKEIDPEGHLLKHKI